LEKLFRCANEHSTKTFVKKGLRCSLEAKRQTASKKKKARKKKQGIWRAKNIVLGCEESGNSFKRLGTKGGHKPSSAVFGPGTQLMIPMIFFTLLLAEFS